MLPVLALATSFNPTNIALATSVGGFFTWLWQENLKNETTGSYDFDIELEYSKFKEDTISVTTELKTYVAYTQQTFTAQLDDYVSSLPDEQTSIVPTVSVPVHSEQTSLIDLFKAQNLQLKENSHFLIEQQQIMNNNLLALNTTLAKLLESHNSQVANQNVLNVAVTEFLPSISLSLAQFATLPKIMATHANYSEILQSETIGSITNLQEQIQNLTTATENQELLSTLNNTNNVNVDTTPIAEQTAKIATATESIAKASDSQIETNTKINEKLDFEKDGLTTLKGSDDNPISPRVAKAIKDYELGLQTKDMNVTDISEFMQYVETGLELLDSGADSLGIEDGISLDFNPIEEIVNALKDLTSEELEKEGRLTNE